MDMTTANVDALIVGAGPVGLTMAAVLNYHGLTCRIIDKAPSPSQHSKALVLWCRTMELLDGIGIAETFVDNGMKLSGASIFAEGKRVVHLDLTSDESAYGFGLMIPQSETERLLTEHLTRQGITIERQIELVDFGERADAVDCTLRHDDGGEEQFEVPWLLGCDGAHSTVRHTLGMEFVGYAEPSEWIIADVQIDGPLAPDEVTVFWREAGVTVFFPYKQNQFRMIADLGPDAADIEVTLEVAQQIAEERGPGGLVLSNPIWLTNFRINERKIAEYRRGRVMLSGDAAHIHSPAGGQGMNTGMQDAFNLAWKLALVHRGQSSAEPLLSSYSQERSAVGQQVLKNASRFTTLTTLQNPVAIWLRNHIVPILGSFSSLRDKIRDSFFELTINYRDSPLTDERWPSSTHGLAAGDRLCDGVLSSVLDGRQTTLFAAIRGIRHALIFLPSLDGAEAVSQLVAIATDTAQLFPGIATSHIVLHPDTAVTNLAMTDTQTWIDVEGQIHVRFDAREPTLVLVRPDGYIGFRCQPVDSEALKTHMSRYLTRA